jgi:predicted GNAT family N-acyltransferase
MGKARFYKFVVQRKNKMFKVVTNQEGLIKVFIVRAIVFIEEQGVPYHIEHDEHDLSATHILGEMDGEPFAAGRIRAVGEYAKLERVAIRKSYRGKNLGHKLTEFMLSVAKDQGFKKFKVHAQSYLKDFYQKHGFEVVGDMFKEAGIDHYLMIHDDNTVKISPAKAL